jgi:SprT-like family.
MQEPLPRTATTLQDELSRLSGKRVLLYLTDNRRRMFTAQRGPDGIVEVRLQRIFLSAPSEVVAEVGSMIANRPTERKALRRFIRDEFENARGPARPARPRARARAMPGDDAHQHDLEEYARQLNATYLGNRSSAAIEWGRRNTTKGRRSIRFGYYDPAGNRIVMNRKLDSAEIPGYYVQYILFHEMLHEVLGIGERPDGKRDIHGSLFKLMEATFPDFDKAQRFEKELVQRLHTL